MTKISKLSESANDSIQVSASANENGIRIFNNQEFGNVRVAGTSEHPMFCLSDLCRILDLRVDGVLPRLKEGGYNRIVVTDSLGRKQQAYFVNEQNLYKVIMRSDKPQAEPFQDWVCGEVLPSIRKHGGYMASKENETTEELLARAYMIAQETLKRKEKRLLEAENKIKEDAPKVEYFNGLIERGNNLCFRDTAKLLGVGEKAFIFMLIDHKYIYRDPKGKLKPIAKHVGKLFVLKEWNANNNNKSGTQTLITVEGREKFKRLIEELKFK